MSAVDQVGGLRFDRLFSFLIPFVIVCVVRVNDTPALVSSRLPRPLYLCSHEHLLLVLISIVVPDSSQCLQFKDS
jgi:hypothetical protein